MAESSMQDFWDRRAEEDPFFFVDNRLPYRASELEQFWSGGEEVIEVFLARLGVSIPPGATVLDIGCGVGRTTRALAQRAARVIGLDVSGRMLDLAREHNRELANVEWLQGDGHTLAEIGSESVDVCFSHVVFQHIPDPAVTLEYVAEIGRVLRPSGWAAFQISNDPGLHRRGRLRGRVRGRVDAMLGRAPRGQSHPAWLGSAVDLGRLRAAASRGGAPVERLVGEGTGMCLVLLRKPDG